MDRPFERVGFELHGRVGLLTLLLLVVALAIAPAAPAQPKDNPRLANLTIEIWPEYDRAGAALVILKGELAPEAAQPAKVALRLPKASGGPSAVAFFKAPGSAPLNLAHEIEQAADAIVVRFEAAERNFLVEFYEPFPAILPARSYTYTWPGDLAADRVTLIVQEPATSSGIEVRPAPDRSATGNDGLRYLSGELGPQPAGKPLPVAVRYTKPDMRTSADIMKLKGGAPAPIAAAPTPGAPADGAVPGPGSVIALLAMAFAVAAAGAALILLWWKRRAPPRAPLPHGACTQCGAPRRPGDRFCGNCGARLA